MGSCYPPPFIQEHFYDPVSHSTLSAVDDCDQKDETISRKPQYHQIWHGENVK